MPKLTFIQGARGLAAMLVLLWHGSRYLGPYGTGIGGALFHPAVTMGVDLFFLLSGFIMVITTRKSDGSAGYALHFLVKRLTRVWPTYAIALLAFVLCFRLDAGPASVWVQTGRALLFLPLGKAGESNVAPLLGVPPLSVGWTLTYEMYFYLVFGVSLLFGRLRWIALLGWAAATLILLPALTAPEFSLWHALIPEYRPPYTGYRDLISNPIIYLFIGGAAIGGLYLSPLRIGSVFWARMVVLLSVTLVVWQYATHAMLWHGVTGAGVSLLPALAGLCLASKTIDIPCPAWLAGLGTISYSLYLWHPLVQTGYDSVLAAAGLPQATTGLPAFLVTTLLSVAVAAVSQRYAEQALSNRLRDALTPAGRRDRD